MRGLVKYLIIMALLVFFSCGEKKQKPSMPVTKSEMMSSMEKANRYLVNEEEEEIENYVRRHEMTPIKTGTGLRYQILKQGTGQKIEKGEEVVLEYELHSIAGDLIYSSENDGLKSFVVGQGQVESGLEEAMSYLHRGDVAKLIIPFHLAYGLHGDDDKIPEYATLVYTIKIIEN